MGWSSVLTSRDFPEFLEDRGMLAEGYEWIGAPAIRQQRDHKTYYRACRCNATGEVFAAVISYYRDEGALYWRFDDETVGPRDTDCPDSILDLLTATKSQWANDWRAACRANNAANNAFALVG